MRTLKLTDKEIELIDQALDEAWEHRIKILETNSRFLSFETNKAIKNIGETFADLKDQIREGKKDT